MDLEKMTYSAYCLKCKASSAKSINSKVSVSSNNRHYLGSQCESCGKPQTRFVSKSVAEQIDAKFQKH